MPTLLAPLSSLLEKNKGGTLQICINYRLPNKEKKIDAYPILQINKLLDQLSQAKVFSKIDLYQGYHQLPVQAGNKYKTAFLYCYSTFEYYVMPLELTNVPVAFQSLMNLCFHDMLDELMIIYLDNLLIYSRKKVEHEVYLYQIFNHLHKETLFAKYKK